MNKNQLAFSSIILACSSLQLQAQTLSQNTIDTICTTMSKPTLTGTWDLYGSVIIDCSIDASSATINIHNPKQKGVQVKSKDNKILSDVDIKLPNVVNVGQHWTEESPGPLTTGFGVRISNLQNSKIELNRINGFHTGMLLLSTASSYGTSYNTFINGHFDNNKRNLIFLAWEGGWVNQNTFVKGTYSHNDSDVIGVTDTSHISLRDSDGGGSIPNNNTWIQPTFADTNAAYTLDWLGTDNMIVNAVWLSSPAPKVFLRKSSTVNYIRCGFSLTNVDVIKAYGTTNNHLDVKSDCWDSKMSL